MLLLLLWPFAYLLAIISFGDLVPGCWESGRREVVDALIIGKRLLLLVVLVVFVLFGWGEVVMGELLPLLEAVLPSLSLYSLWSGEAIPRGLVP